MNKYQWNILLQHLLLIALFSISVSSYSQSQDLFFEGKEMLMEFNKLGIKSIISQKDQFRANPIRTGNIWGNVHIMYRVGTGAWLNIYTGNTVIDRVSPKKIVYKNTNQGTTMNLFRTFEKIDDDKILFTARVENRIPFPLTIGDFYFSFPANHPQNFLLPDEIFEQGYIRHQYIGGEGSFLFYTRGAGQPPFLVVTPVKGTGFEYFEGDNIYIHSHLSANKLPKGSWRQGNTEKILSPKGEEGSIIEYGYILQWADSYDEIRDILYEDGLFDVRIIPGMTIPQDLNCKISLRTTNHIDSIVAEYPDQTKITYLKTVPGNNHIYEINFRQLGENLITVHYNGEEKTILEFFSTESLNTLIRKRTQFIIKSQQHKDSTKWYNGLYSLWDMEHRTLRGPDDTDGFDHWWGYVLAADDPALCKAPFLAAKNVYFPVDEEIKSIEYYIENFVWGGLQRTDKEKPYPYGIYGVPNWKVNRGGIAERATIRNTNLDKIPVWRAYDYPHIFMLYYHMFQIAEFYPQKVKFRDAKGYLDLAYQTSKAYFLYPYEILPYYEIYQWGYYNELVLMPLIDELKKYGMIDEAEWLRAEWEKKVKYFVYDDKYPYRSEYSFDRTAFESTYALAKYGVLNKMEPDVNLWYDINRKKWYSHSEVHQKNAREFMERQHFAGLAVRGWIEPSYYHYGADFSLSYMARMGGWSILDYGLTFAERPWDWLQLGYASYLSSFALMNTGTEKTNYGYWYPGKENDGAMGWAYNNKKYGSIWLQNREQSRGAWIYDGEADLGNGAIFRMSSTILAKDPLFGWYAYGGKMNHKGALYSVIPRDGVRNRFWIVDEDFKIGIEVTRDGFEKETAIVYSESAGTIEFFLENRVNEEHFNTLIVRAEDNWDLYLDNKKMLLNPALRMSEQVMEALLPVTGKKHKILLKKKKK